MSRLARIGALIFSGLLMLIGLVSVAIGRQGFTDSPPSRGATAAGIAITAIGAVVMVLVLVTPVRRVK
jgi:hypothetical protein